MPDPQMLDGMRAPRSVRLEDMRENAAAAEIARAVPMPAALAPEGVTVYVSRYARYRVQVATSQTFVGLNGRKEVAGKNRVAQFDNGVFRNDDRDPEVRKLYDDVLQHNKYFGRFGSNADFWLYSEQVTQTKEKQIASALNTLKSLPKEAVDLFVAELRQGDAEDHVLPAAPAPGPDANALAAAPAKRGARPIPTAAE